MGEPVEDVERVGERMVMDDDGVDWGALYGAMRENGLDPEGAAGRDGPERGVQRRGRKLMSATRPGIRICRSAPARSRCSSP